ncbi:MAG: acetyl-CoA carboxylase biotin carboxyl carrier protein subunit [Pseudomonadota bacterium]
MAKHNVESEVAGNVWKVLMNAGDKVNEGDVIMILESMKMEIPVEAPADGTLEQVLVAPEDQVEEDQLLAVVTAD